MKKWMKIYRGVSLLGYAGLDDGLGSCHPFEAAEGFWEVEPLFTKEHELTMQLADDNVSQERVDEMFEACEALMQEILAPGVSMTTLEDTHCFDCLELCIGDGRVCWR